MTIEVGQTLPDATLSRIGADGPEAVRVSDLLTGRKVIIFGLPGAYTGTCSTAHVPSFVRTAAQFAEKGVDEIVCLSVNDPFVMKAWGDDTGAIAAGISMLGDSAGEFTKAIGMDFTVPISGFYGRSRRYSMLVDNGVVKIFNEEVGRGVCEISAGETLLAQV